MLFLLQSFMPETSEKILSQIQAENCDLENLAFGQYVSGTKVVEKPEILFARLDLSEVMAQVEEIHLARQRQQRAEQPRARKKQ